MGEGFDPHRVKKLWKIYKKGPVHANAPASARWNGGSCGGGWPPASPRDSSASSFRTSHRHLVQKKKSRLPRQEFTEMWMATANMERLHVKDKIVLGRQLIARLKSKKPQPQLLWALSRIGARDLLYGSIDRVTPPLEVAGWVETILSLPWKNTKPVAEMLSQLCRKTGDPLRDIPQEVVGRAVEWIDAAGDFSEQLERIRQPSPRKRERTEHRFWRVAAIGTDPGKRLTRNQGRYPSFRTRVTGPFLHHAHHMDIPYRQ
jgi:hypothetical protein